MRLTHKDLNWLYQLLNWVIIDYYCPDIAYHIRDKLALMTNNRENQMSKAGLIFGLLETALKHSTEIFDLVDNIEGDLLDWKNRIKALHDEIKAKNDADK